jgi:hypothetical protein
LSLGAVEILMAAPSLTLDEWWMKNLIFRTDPYHLNSVDISRRMDPIWIFRENIPREPLAIQPSAIFRYAQGSPYTEL